MALCKAHTQRGWRGVGACRKPSTLEIAAINFGNLLAAKVFVVRERGWCWEGWLRTLQECTRKSHHYFGSVFLLTLEIDSTTTNDAIGYLHIWLPVLFFLVDLFYSYWKSLCNLKLRIILFPRGTYLYCLVSILVPSAVRQYPVWDIPTKFCVNFSILPGETGNSVR